MARVSLFLAVCGLMALSAHANVDFKCLLTKCGAPMMACGVNKDCFFGYSCMGSCFGDMDCIYKCWATYYNDALNKLVDCSMGEHQCIAPPVPHPTVCRKPTENSLATGFSLKYLTGKFYNVYGLNPLYECRDYSHKKFEKRSNGTLLLTEWYDLPMNDNTPRTFQDQQEFSLVSPSVLNVVTVGAGMRRADEYRVLSFSETHVFVYYCGKACGIGYEGAVVYSRTPQISKEDQMLVQKVAANQGWNIDQFCQPKQKAVMK